MLLVRVSRMRVERVKALPRQVQHRLAKFAPQARGVVVEQREHMRNRCDFDQRSYCGLRGGRIHGSDTGDGRIP